MALKALLSIVGVDHPDSAVTLVRDLARSVDAHLGVVVSLIGPPFPVTEFAVVPDTWIRERQEGLRMLRMRTEAVKQLLAGQEVAVSVESRYIDNEWPDGVFGKRARCADLCVLEGNILADAALSKPVLNGMLFESGRPVLLVPDDTRPTLRPQRVMVAWDGGVEAARAIGEAMGLIEGAQEVIVAMVDPIAGDDMGGKEPGADIRAYLARHSANVRVDRVASCGKSVAQALAMHGTDTAADLLVMGAYGHSRLRQRIFGGVTQSILKHATLPVLMAH